MIELQQQLENLEINISDLTEEKVSCICISFFNLWDVSNILFVTMDKTAFKIEKKKHSI